ncbi:MAG: lamin tail domain-containing protein [Bacteroidales bacterium]|nr:lamin tail domain-containing protein [Bacteroidales bacterium]
MKRIVFIVVSIMCLYASAQNTFSIQSVGANSVTINYSIVEDATLYIYENDTVYYEDFSLFQSTGTDADHVSLVYNNFLWPLPESYLKTKGAKAQYVKKYTDTTGINLIKGSIFRTSEIDLSKTNSDGNYSYSLYTEIRKVKGSSSLIVSNNYGNTIYSTTATESLFFDSVRTSPDLYLEFAPNTSGSGSREYNISKIVVTIPQEYCNKQNYSILAANTSYIINDLLPNTKYVLALGEDTLSFTTLKEKTLDSIKEITTNSASVYITNNTPSNKKLKVVKKGNTYNFADDLIISQFIYTNNVDAKAIELYNGTGRDICLNDYELHYYPNQLATYSFTERDSIKHGEAIVLYSTVDVLSSEISGAGKFYCGMFLFFGNRPSILLHNTDTIDIFGNNTVAETATDWTCENFNSRDFVLRRNSDINYGVKHNPDSGFPTLCTEWTGDNSTDESNFRDFGLHTLTGTISQADIANIGLGTPISESNISLQDGYYQIDNLEEKTYYVAYLVSEDESIVYGYKGFLTKGTTARTTSGEWTDTNWTNGEPTFNDVVQINNGVDVTVSQGNTAKCNTLILKDGASFKNNGTANIDTYEIEKSFSGYESKTLSSTGWYLTGIPIEISSDNQTYIAEVLDAREDNDDIDLYFWKEDYTEEEMQGMWANYKAYDFAEPFFKEGRGYLISYANNTTNSFSGKINDNSSYTLLNNATLSGAGSYYGWHLVANPYSFPISLSQIERTNSTVPSFLNSSGNYEVLMGANTLQPFEGFFVQVDNSANSFVVNKNEPIAKSSLNDINFISFSINNIDGEDKTYLAFDTNFTNALEWQTDNHKLLGYGLAPEIYTTFDNENFAVNVIPPSLEDTLNVDLRCIIKQEGEYTLKYRGEIPLSYNKIGLYDRQSGEMLKDFSLDSVYVFSADETMDEDKFMLKFIRNSLGGGILTSSHFINISQENNLVRVYSDEEISLITLYSMDGKDIYKTKDKEIVINKKGFFLLKVKTTNSEKVFKVIIV